ncbi:putative receptor protein kinase ZmPK1 [Lycium barbarum]|uniref:putative receptor protein kinase ZmPK1 n=1 Tax=Lycium barbarum TaxID=112863 RepID=UPI00293F3759|nr:putative receptor protein kinase ZmPK1 [Lycium barbarum]
MYKPVFCLVIHFSLFLVAPTSSSSIITSLSKGFHAVGENAYIFAIWFTNLVGGDKNYTIVWMANRDDPVNGRHSLISLTKSGDLVLTDAGQRELLPVLPGQALTKNSKLVPLRSSTNYSSGFYKLQCADNNVLQLLYEGLEMSGGIQRRLTLDIDGYIRVYSLNTQRTNWEVTWQLNWRPCMIHGICANSLCTYSYNSGRKCTCLQRHKMKNVTDWSYGCEADFKLSCSDRNMVDFVHLHHIEFFGYEVKHYKNHTFEQCKQDCLDSCNCKGFQFNFEMVNGVYSCYLKTLLFNGYRSPSWKGSVYIKLPKDVCNSDEEGPIGKLQCERTHVLLDRSYERKQQSGWLKSFIGFTVALGVLEFRCLVSYLTTTPKRFKETFDLVYIPVVNRFKRFTYAELKKATSNFRDEIGQGSGGVVYKGKLSDNRIAAIKYLKLEANQGKAEFLAEQKRFEIALGTAKGLAYLHEERLEWVLHCDIKPHNIFLDSNCEPKATTTLFPLQEFQTPSLLLRSLNPDLPYPKSLINRVAATINYASAVNCSMISCFFEHHEKHPKPRLKQCLNCEMASTEKKVGSRGASRASYSYDTDPSENVPSIETDPSEVISSIETDPSEIQEEPTKYVRER